jgi:hypothetical protein
MNISHRNHVGGGEGSGGVSLERRLSQQGPSLPSQGKMFANRFRGMYHCTVPTVGSQEMLSEESDDCINAYVYNASEIFCSKFEKSNIHYFYSQLNAIKIIKQSLIESHVFFF